MRKQLFRWEAAGFLFAAAAGTLLQQLYAFVDTAMVGRLLGEDALAAVGTTHSLHFLTIGFAQGVCLGFGIPLAQAVGARDLSAQRQLFWNGLWLCIVFALVMTGLTVLSEEKCVTCTEVADIHFRALTEQEISDYVATGEPMDKAGSYGIQGGAALFAEKLVGDYYNVMGLPVCRLYLILKEFMEAST